MTDKEMNQKAIARLNNRTRIDNKLKPREHDDKIVMVFQWVKHQNLTCKNFKYIIDNYFKEEYGTNQPET